MEAKKDNAAAKLEKKQAKAKAKAEVKPKAKGKAKGKPKGKASKKNPCDKAELKRKSDAAAPKRKLKKTKVAVVSPHSTPVKPTGGRSWKPSPMALKESGGGKDRRFQKAVDALGELMDAMGTYKGKDFHGPGPKFAKKFLALINYTGP